MDKSVSLAELLLSIHRPPFFPKLSLLGTLLAQLGAVYIVVNKQHTWGSDALFTALEWINLPVLTLRSSQSALVTLLVVSAVLVFTLCCSAVAVQRYKRSLPVSPLLGKVTRAVAGVIGRCFSSSLQIAQCVRCERKKTF